MSLWWRAALMALFLLAITPAEGLDVSVSVDQRNRVEQPFDVNDTIDYSIHLSGANRSSRYSLVLEVGPDLRNPNLKSIYRDSVHLEVGKARTLQFPVDFRSVGLVGGEYEEWLLDLENTTPWCQAWYRLEMVSSNPAEKPVLLDSYSGWPQVVKMVEMSRNHSVYPGEGTRDDTFCYRASLFCTREENITLLAAPSPKGPWTSLGERAYTEPGVWQILEWDKVALDFNFDMASYRFKGLGLSPAYEGPSRPIAVQIQNSSALPEKAMSNQNFTFDVRLKATQDIEVSLILLDPARNITSSGNRLKYTKSPQWETLVWRDVSLRDMARFNGSLAYLFEFYREGSSMPFSSSQMLTGMLYPGPELILINIVNATVTPPNGSLQMPFSYCVYLQSATDNSTLELQTADCDSSNWSSRGILPCNQSTHHLCWNGVTFSGEVEPSGKRYRLLSDGRELEAFPGPWIDLTFGNLYYKKADQSDRYDYSVEVIASRPGLTVDLIYTDDQEKWQCAGLVKKSVRTGYQIITWKGQPWHQAVAFKEVFEETAA